LIALRRRNPWLHSAVTRPVQLTKTLFSYESVGDSQRLFVALNIGESPVSILAPGCTQLLAGQAHMEHDSPGEERFLLGGHQWAVVA